MGTLTQIRKESGELQEREGWKGLQYVLTSFSSSHISFCLSLIRSWIEVCKFILSVTPQQAGRRWETFYVGRRFLRLPYCTLNPSLLFFSHPSVLTPYLRSRLFPSTSCSSSSTTLVPTSFLPSFLYSLSFSTLHFLLNPYSIIFPAPTFLFFPLFFTTLSTCLTPVYPSSSSPFPSCF